jgi:RNA polymerase sigma factor (sigma-70 family)
MVSSNNQEIKLVQRAVRGNQKAFTTLFNKYFTSVYNFALMLSRDPAMAEDLTQEAFIRAHSKIRGLGPPWNFRAWIFRLTRNYFIDQTRKEREVDPLEEGEPVKSTGPGPEKETMSRETAGRVQGTLNKMRAQHREILVLRELNQFSYAEIGEILNISGSNVKVSLHRARAAFQDNYGIQLLLDDPEGECQDVSALLGPLHDEEELLDQEQFVKEHIKVCEACQQRKQMLIDQSLIFGAFIPVIPSKALSEQILRKTVQKNTWQSPPKQHLFKIIMGYGGAAVVLGMMVWFVFTLIFNTNKILPNFPRSDDMNNTPEVLAPAAPPETTVQPSPPPPSPPETDRCSLFDEIEISLVLLNIREGSLNIPLYLKMGDGVPGGSKEEGSSETQWTYSAWLGDITAYKCDLQGFPDRLYCMFTLQPDMPGQEQVFQLSQEECLVYSQVILLPTLPMESQDQPIGCHADLDDKECKIQGGEYRKIKDTQYLCFCPPY